MKSDILLKKVVIVAIFSALCCAATYLQIRMPAGDFVHLGNFVMIIAALLLGGVEGGAVGSLGMGIYDLINYAGKTSTILRTFILKFIIGFIVGSLFRLILKKKLKVNVLMYITVSIFTILFVTSLIFFIVGTKNEFSFKTGYNSTISNFLNSGKDVKISVYIPIFSGIFLVGSTLAAIFSKKFSTRRQAALFAITIAVLVNIIGEFLLRWFLEGILLDGFEKSLITATSKIPGSLITGLISVFLAVLIYEPIYMAVKNTDIFKDDTVTEEELEKEKEETEIELFENDEKKASV